MHSSSARGGTSCRSLTVQTARDTHGDYHASYWVSGVGDYDKVIAACHRLGIRGGRYYDFGGSTGRVFRHFYCQDRVFEVWSFGLQDRELQMEPTTYADGPTCLLEWVRTAAASS